MRIPVFRVFYSTTYTIIFVLTLALLLVSPGDGIFQSYLNRRLWNVVIIAGTYLLTLLAALFIYATRIYINRQHLASIPRSYIPIRKGDVSKAVRKIIENGLSRSAAIAYNAHPRSLKEGENSTQAEAERLGTAIKSLNASPTRPPPWGIVAHPGWSSPSSEDLPKVHYEPVLLELPHLVEARAVSLAPPDPLSDPTPATTSSQPPVILPDPVAVSILQRHAGQTLRDYLTHLCSLSILEDYELQADFLTLYERARFSTRPLTEAEFRKLMSVFSSILQSMTAPDPELLAILAVEPSSSMTASSSRPSLACSFSRASSVLDRLGDREDFSSTVGVTSVGVVYTPFFTPSQHNAVSLSSNDGDHDDDSENTAHTAWTRLTRQNRGVPRNGSRYNLGMEPYQTPRVTMRESYTDTKLCNLGVGDHEGVIESDDSGSNVRKVKTGSSGKDSVGAGSVIVRRGAGEELDFPVIRDREVLDENALGIT